MAVDARGILLADFFHIHVYREKGGRYLKLEEDANSNFLGYPDGLGINFDNDNFIRTVGVLNGKLHKKKPAVI